MSFSIDVQVGDNNISVVDTIMQITRFVNPEWLAELETIANQNVMRLIATF